MLKNGTSFEVTLLFVQPDNFDLVFCFFDEGPESKAEVFLRLIAKSNRIEGKV